MNGLSGLAQRTQATAADISEALSVAAPPPQPGAPPPTGGPPSPTSGLAVQPPPPRDPGDSMLGTMTDFKSPPLAAALQGARGAQGPTGFARGGFVVRV